MEEGRLGLNVCADRASRGFGHTLALLCLPGSMLLLRACSHLALLQPSWPLVGWAAADLDTKARVQQLLCTLCKLPRPKCQQSLLIINNAGTLGDISKGFLNMSDPAEVNNYGTLNMTSCSAQLRHPESLPR
ncbi:Sepiapterin reductase [Cricetulus griseus]|uniref:Sepiapterin reductase n=1 Tax=Cricetulus griseus TaxID=10029 RepID=G3IES7_CRIGR|nr:Sepiapterin reductase [Cricetulus griseus]